MALGVAQDVSTVRSAGTLLAPLSIARDRCKGCSLCVEVCPKHVLALDESVVNRLGYHPVRLLDAGACTSCVLCARVCPDSVFTVFAPARGA
jgi:2-oxoglutarate ferredoxin oxidoreductase subunit delta